ncbi:MAG: hypothetical protein AB1543_03775 [Candidatus Bipolaricaulota bacterium]
MTNKRGVSGASAVVSATLFALSLGLVTVLRLARLFPNNDPILAVVLSYARRGRLGAVVFPAAAMVLFDLMSQQVGPWTVITAGTYGLLGFGFSCLYGTLTRRGYRITTTAFPIFGVAGVLVFDFVTGPIMSSVLFRVSFFEALVGQVPFTLRHLLSVVAYTLVVSPALDRVLGRIERLRLVLRDRIIQGISPVG